MPTVALSIGLTEPIGEWGSLVNILQDFLDRNDITDARVTDMIAAAEARFNRVLRHPEMERIATTTLTTGNNALPADFLAMRSIYANGRELRGMTPVSLISQYGTAAGVPCAYALIGGQPRQIRLGPQPGAPVEVTMVYYAKIEGVNENNPDNWLLNEHPDIYLAGCLLWLESYLADDDRLPIWKSAVDEFLAELDRSAQRDRYGSGPLVASSVPQIAGCRA